MGGDVNYALGMICGYVLMMQHCLIIYASPLYKVIRSGCMLFESYHISSGGGWYYFSAEKWGGINVDVVCWFGRLLLLTADNPT